MGSRKVSFFAGLLVAWVQLQGQAEAAPLKVKNAVAVRVTMAQGSQRGLGVKPERDGWRLQLSLAKVSQDTSVEVIDVTPGTPARTLSVLLRGEEALLDGQRFEGGHVYRVQLRSGSGIDSAYVYLYPSGPVAAVKEGPTKLEFAGDEREGTSGPAPVRKSAL